MHKHKRKWIKLVVKVWKWTQKRNFEVKWKRSREALFFCCLMEAGVGAEAEAVIFFSQATWRQSKTTGFSSLVDSWTSGQLFELQFWRNCGVPLNNPHWGAICHWRDWLWWTKLSLSWLLLWLMIAEKKIVNSDGTLNPRLWLLRSPGGSRAHDALFVML